jgi:hypothetical protein
MIGYIGISPDMVEYHKIWYIMIICNPDLSYLYWRFLASQAMYSYINHPLRLNNHQSINYSINSILLQSYYPSPSLKHYQLGSWFEFGFSLMYLCCVTFTKSSILFAASLIVIQFNLIAFLVFQLA